MMTRICSRPGCHATATVGAGTFVRSVSRKHHHMIELDYWLCDPHLAEAKADPVNRHRVACAHGLPQSIEANFQRAGDPVDWSTLEVYGVPVAMSSWNHNQWGYA